MSLQVRSCLFACALSVAPLSAQAAAPQVATHPLRALIGRAQATPRLPMWSFLDLDSWEASTCRLPSGEQGASLFDPDSAIALVRGALRDTVPEEEVELELIEDGTMLVSADGRLVKRAVDAAKQLETAVTRSLVVRASLWDWTDPAVPTVATAEQWAKLIEGREPIWSAAGSTRSNAPLHLGQRRIVRYVRSCEAEVSIDAKIGLPRVARAFTGIGLLVSPHALIASDRIAVMCQLAIGEQIGKIESRGRLEAQPSLQAPRLAIDAATMSGVIDDGGVLLYAVTSPRSFGNSRVLAVQCSWQGARVRKVGEQRLFPVSALRSAELRAASVAAEEGEGSVAPVLRRSFEEEAMPVMDTGRVVDLIRSTIDPESWDVEDAAISEGNGWLFVSAAPPTVDAVENLLLQLQNKWMRTVDVEMTTEAAPAEGEGPFARGASSGGEVLHRMRLPGLIGRSHQVVHGVETTVIRSMGAELAENSVIAVPGVQSVFDGVFGEVLPFPAAMGLAASVLVEVSHSESTARPLDTPYGGQLDLSAAGHARFAHDGPLAQGGVHILGAGPVVRRGDAPWRTRQSVRVVER